MRKIFASAVILVSALMIFHKGSFAADKKMDGLYELYNSTSTPAIYKDRIGSIIESLERRKAVVETAKKKHSKSAKTAAPKMVFTQSADATFQASEIYCFPNPAKRVNPTFHMETGIADKVELNIYDVSGSLVHDAVITGQPQIIDDGQGAQYAYEYAWDTSKIASGVYPYSVKAVKDSRVIKKTGKCAVIR